MFSDELEKISWEETTKAIYSKTDADVRRALSKEHCDVNDFMALISPAAAPYLETMARLSRKYTMERFGKTISMFVPLYITNSCTNSCVYCGFNHNNPMKRTILTEEEMVNEYKAIKKLARVSACNRSPSEWLTACASPNRSCCMSCVPYWRVQRRKCIRPP